MARAKLERVPTAWEKVHRASQGSLLLAERQALVTLRGVVRDVSNHVLADLAYATPSTSPERIKHSAIRAIRTAATRLRHEFARETEAARANARDVALQRIAVELDLVRRELHKLEFPRHTWPANPPASDGAEDGALADASASSFAAAWTAATLSTVLTWADAPTGSLARRVAAAVDAQAPRVGRIAATEVSRAYNDETLEGMGYVAAEHESATWLPALFKVWNAELDRATCPACRAHDGEMVVYGLDFDGDDEPGDLHPYCRCLATTVFLPLRLRPGSDKLGHVTPEDEEDAA